MSSECKVESAFGVPCTRPGILRKMSVGLGVGDLRQPVEVHVCEYHWPAFFGAPPVSCSISHVAPEAPAPSRSWTITFRERTTDLPAEAFVYDKAGVVRGFARSSVSGEVAVLAALRQARGVSSMPLWSAARELDPSLDRE